MIKTGNNFLYADLIMEKEKSKMNTQTWWIGDPVQVISTGVKGKYHGQGPQGEIILKHPDGSLTSVPAEDILLTEEEIETVHETIQWDPEKEARIGKGSNQSYRLDLHYEHLVRHFTPPPHLTILEFQLDVCKQFIEAAIASKMPFIRIIYGRGKGVLKSEVEKMLRQFTEFTIISFNPNMAAVDAWIK